MSHAKAYIVAASWENQSSGFPTRFNTNSPLQLEILHLKMKWDHTIYVVKTKVLVSCHCTADLCHQKAIFIMLQHTLCQSCLLFKHTKWAASWETNNLHMQNQRRRSASRQAKLISAFVFATRIVLSLFYLNPKSKGSRIHLYMCSSVCVRPVQNPHCWFSHEMAQIQVCSWYIAPFQ